MLHYLGALRDTSPQVEDLRERLNGVKTRVRSAAAGWNAAEYPQEHTGGMRPSPGDGLAAM